MKKIIILFFLISITLSSKGQDSFNKEIEIYNHSVEGMKVHQYSNGDLLIGGRIDFDILLMKLNSNLDTIWTKKYGTRYIDYFKTFEISNSNSILIGGQSEGFSTSSWPQDLYLIHNDENGDTIWTKHYDIYGSLDEFCSLKKIENEPNNYLILASSSSTGTAYLNFVLLKIDANGDTIKSKIIDISYQDWGGEILKFDDNTYGFIGVSNDLHNDSDSTKIVISKFNSNLESINLKQIKVEKFRSFKCFSKGHELICAGVSTKNKETDLSIIKIDSAGNVSTRKDTNISFYGTYPSYIGSTKDNGFIVIGYCDTILNSTINHNIFICKYNPSWQIEWFHVFKEEGFQYAYNGAIVDDGYLIVGSTNKNSINNRIKIIKISLDGNITTVKTLNIKKSIDLYPNPTDKIINIITETNKKYKVDLYGIKGNLVLSKICDTNERQIDISSLKSGIYIIKVFDNESIMTSKIIIKK